MTWNELVAERDRKRKVYQDSTDPRKRFVVLALHDQHFHDGSAWQDVVEDIVDGTVSGFAHKCDRMRHAIHIGETGTRRWMPRRDHPTEYVEFGGLEYWTGSAWASVPLGSPTRGGNRISWDTANFSLSLTVIWHRIKIEAVLKTEVARRRLRWAVSLSGLTYNAGVLTSIADSVVVGHIDKPIAWDANGSWKNQNVTIVTTYSGGYLEFGGDLSLAVLPVTIDPTVTVQPDGTDGLDCWMDDDSVGFDSSTSIYTYIGDIGSGEILRQLIKFNLTTVPDTFDSATVSLYCLADDSSNARTFRVFRQKRAWIETANWTDYGTPGQAWQTAGGFGANDCEQTDIGSRAFTATETLNQFKDFALTPVTKANLDLGNGWLFKADTESADGYQFASSDNTTAANRPKLVVQYTTSFTLVVQDAAHAQTATSTVGMNATHTHTAESPTLTYHESGPSLVVQNSAHAQTAEAPALTQHNVLAVAAAAQAQASDNAALTQHGALVVANAAQAHTAGATVLTQHNVLAVANAAQAQTAESNALTQHNALAVANAAQAQAADSPALTQHNALVVAGTAHAHSADNVALAQHGILALANAAHAQAAENVVLTAHGISGAELVVQNATHLQTNDLTTLVIHMEITTSGELVYVVTMAETCGAVALAETHGTVTMAETRSAATIAETGSMVTLRDAILTA